MVHRLRLLRETLERRLGAEQPFDVALTLSLLLLMLRPPDWWYVRLPVVILALVALIYRPMRMSARLWYLLFLFLFAGCLFNWHSADNHKYLTAYWCLAIATALQSESPSRILARNARWLVGLCFLFALSWKLLSPDFSDGRFFHHTLLLDERFAWAARWIGGLEPEDSVYNELQLRDVFAFDGTAQSAELRDTPRIRWLAKVMTAWCLLIESAVAVAFLAPEHLALHRFRDSLLITFIATTYGPATVVGFGWLLVVMGLSQTDPHLRSVQMAYVGCFLLIEVYRLPIAKLVAAFAALT